MPPEFPTKFTVLDYALTPFYLLIIFLVAYYIKKRNIEEYPYFKYFIPGLLVKMFGAFSVCYIYLYYYVAGGDTLNYFYSGKVLLALASKESSVFFRILGGELTPENYSAFTSETGIPLYFKDPLSFFVVRFITPFIFLSFGSYLVASIAITCVTYSGIWKLYSVFMDQFPFLAKEIAIAVLFIPSVFFWGSGILKDPLTLSAIGWFTYSLYKVVLKREYKISNFIYLFLSSYIMLSIKPYIFYALLIATSLWLVSYSLGKIKGTFIKYIALPIFMLIFGGGGYLLLLQVGQEKGSYSINNILDYGAVVQHDLKSEAYQGNSFDIGNFDGTISSALSVAPLAINAALFRPYLWEAHNPVMLFSALENTFMLLLTIYLLWKLKVVNLFSLVNKHNMLFFSFTFSILFAFSVGLTTSNYGSLVRYKIPAIPFYLASLFILRYYYEAKKKSTNHAP